MKHEFKIHLSPLEDGELTRLRLYGPVVTALPPCELRRLIRQLCHWSGAPVELVLPVDVGTDAWFELWSYALLDVPDHHLRVRFRLPRRRGHDGGGDVA